jgi:hypothetical protein
LYQEEQPYEIHGFPDKGSAMQTNCVMEEKTVQVEDARSRESEFTLGGCGFTFFRYASRCDLDAKYFEAALEGNSVVDSYLAETMKMVKEKFAASKVILFDWRFRRNAPSSVPLLDVKNIRFNALPVACATHCDFSTIGGYDRLTMHLTAEELREFRAGSQSIIFVNVWRPLFTVENAPLILLDRRSASRRDLVEIDKVLPDKVEKNFLLHHREYHKWFWLSNQKSDEVTMFLAWTPEAPTNFADSPPHAAPADNEYNTRPRESVEVRLAVYLPQPLDRLGF